MATPSDDLTVLLRAWADGDSEAESPLVEQIYPLLRRLASRQLAGENRRRALATTELANEAYLQLFRGMEIDWQDRRHFTALAATVVRRVVVDLARQRASQKRGGEHLMLSLEGLLNEPGSREQHSEVIALADALERLARVDEEAAKLTELRFFGGLDLDEAAATLDLSIATAGRRWRFARAWLKRRLGPNGDGDS